MTVQLLLSYMCLSAVTQWNKLDIADNHRLLIVGVQRSAVVRCADFLFDDLLMWVLFSAGNSVKLDTAFQFTICVICLLSFSRPNTLTSYFETTCSTTPGRRWYVILEEWDAVIHQHSSSSSWVHGVDTCWQSNTDIISDLWCRLARPLHRCRSTCIHLQAAAAVFQ